MSAKVDDATVELNEKLAEVDELIDNMMKIGATMAHERGLNEKQTAVFFASIFSKQLDETEDPANTLLPLFVGRLLTCMIMSTGAMDAAMEAIEHLMKQQKESDA